jgi:hypothetical protein
MGFNLVAGPLLVVADSSAGLRSWSAPEEGVPKPSHQNSLQNHGLSDLLAAGAGHDHGFVGGAVLPVVVDRETGLALRFAAGSTCSELARRAIASGEGLGPDSMFSHALSNN